MSSLSDVFRRIVNMRINIHPLFVIGILIAAIAAVAFFSSKPNYPAEGSPDVGFARDMTSHHEQAVNMSFIVRENSNDQEVRQLAYDIINTQQSQIGMMSGWLQIWGLPQTSTAKPLAWAGNEVKAMPHSTKDHMNMSSSDSTAAMMPGMATPEQIEQLKNLKGNDAVKQYLKLMIAHHQGGIMMAKGALKLGANQQVKQLAQTIRDGQQAEIEAMQQMLTTREANGP